MLFDLACRLGRYLLGRNDGGSDVLPDAEVVLRISLVLFIGGVAICFRRMFFIYEVLNFSCESTRNCCQRNVAGQIVGKSDSNVMAVNTYDLTEDEGSRHNPL